MSHCLPASAEASGDGLHLPRSVLHGEMERWMQKQHIVALRIAGSRAFIYVRSVIGRDAGNFRLQSQEQCKRCVQGASPTLPCKCRPDCNGAFPTGWEYGSQASGIRFPGVGNAIPGHREDFSICSSMFPVDCFFILLLNLVDGFQSLFSLLLIMSTYMKIVFPVPADRWKPDL